MSQLIIDYPTLSGDYTGGSTIVSLHLQWDKGTGGEAWTTLIGDNPYSTSVAYTYSSGLIQSGRIYKFRYRARNVFGWGEFSEQGDVLAAAEPDKMDQVTVTLIGTDVKIAWTPPEENGSPITAYKIEIQTQDPLAYEEELTYCDGTSESAVTLNYCLIPMLDFSEEPFDLAQGDLIIARVRAQNSIGWSDPSIENDIGQQVQTAPLPQPADLAVNFDQTDEQQIALMMTEITLTEDTGGSAIVSYSLEWDGGSLGLSYEALVGYDSNNIQLAYIKDSLTNGIVYSFRYRVRNIYGWSPYSNVLQQIAARHPDDPVAPVTQNTATSVTISWQLPYNGGSGVTAYILQITGATAGVFHEEPTYCNAQHDSTVINNRFCAIPMSVLTSDFQLEQGTEVVARVLAINSLG